LMAIHPAAVVHPAAVLGDGCEIAPFCVVEEGARIGAGCLLEPHVRICRHVVVGIGSRIGQGAVVGGLAQVREPGEPGGCVLADGVRVGEYATIHRAAQPTGTTRVGCEAMILAYAHVAHDCTIGNGATLANGVQLGGHVEVGEFAFLGGGAHVHQHTRVGEFAFVAGCLRLDRDLAPWSRGMGEPPRWAGLNRTALRRTPGAPDPMSAESALRILFRGGLRLSQALEKLAACDDPASRKLYEFAKGGNRGLLRPSA